MALQLQHARHPGVVTERGQLVLAATLVEKCLARYGLEGQVIATTPGEKLAGIAFRHPLAHVHAGYDRLSPVYLADYATAEDGTGVVHSAPAYGLDDFNSCVSHGLAFEDILNPVQCSARDMDPRQLKARFGERVTFWGGGVDTQNAFDETHTPDEVRADVRKRVEDLMPGGGFVFNTVHNIQGNVPPENIMAMWETLQEFGRYSN